MSFDLTRSALLTDFYQLTMLDSYVGQGMTDEAVFEFFVRDASPARHWFVAAGLGDLLGWLEGLHVTDAEREWLRSTGQFSDALLDYLEGFRFTGDVWAMPEGTVCFPEEPLVRVRAPLPQAQLIETRLINIIHFQTLIATKAARCRIAAGNRRIVDFGLRRAHGGEAGLWAARACHLAGFDGTATVLAGHDYDIPLTGTMAHSFILAHASEKDAFRHFARTHPENVILLIDTYDVERGARRVVEIAPELAADGIPIKGVRIDSGDLATHARAVRRILDDAGLTATNVLVSGGLDEWRLAELVASGAPIDGFGVGSAVDTSADHAFLDCAYKLHEYAGTARAKRSEGKADLPGSKQVFRDCEAGRIRRDVIALASESCSGTPLLRHAMRAGRTLECDDLETARARCAKSLASLPDAARRLTDGRGVTVERSPGLAELAMREQRNENGAD